MITDLDLNLSRNPDQPLEQINLGYSTKNIPTCSEKQYIKSLINRTEQFVKNVRWKAFFFLNPGLNIENKETYGFNSTRPPPFIPELKEFEDGLTSIIEKIKFRKVNNTFQQKLRKDITKIKYYNHLLIPADKTNNYYKLKSEQHETLLNKSIQKEYKKSTETGESHITREDKNIAERLKLSDRINITAKREAFLTLKDHKPNSNNKPSCRLINPFKPELGKISKQIVEKIVHDVKSKANINQWKNTNDVINWFNNIDNKNSHTMICFDICDFYPYISNELLQNAIKFASKYSVITDDQVHIIKHTKKTTLYKDGEPWCKKT